MLTSSFTFRQRGFTIVELLLVIVIIGILVTIVTFNYTGSQAKARDSKRIIDAKAIEAALDAYRSENIGFPAATIASQVAGASTGGWETSGAAQPGTFMSALKSFGLPTGTPIDPTNNSLTTTGKTYRYMTYVAGTNGCNSTKGDYYVFVVNDLETVSGVSPKSPGFSCTGKNWQLEGDYVIGRFVNE